MGGAGQHLERGTSYSPLSQLSVHTQTILKKYTIR